MDSSEDKLWASKYLLDPLTAPQPHQETGPGSRFNSTVQPAKIASTTTLPTPPTSVSPSRSTFHHTNPYAPTYRQQTSGAYTEDGPSKEPGNDKSVDVGKSPGRRRGNSLGERFPGDMSHRPLDVLKRQAKAADRAPHLKKKHIPGADIIDSLDRSFGGVAYHHGGPYDATLLARNNDSFISPVAAVKDTNAEALRATPKERIRDALDKHVPLQGTADIPSGDYDLSGKKMEYEEGADIMREESAGGGAYRRWAGMKYHPDDLKGKGESSFLIERALKEHGSNPKSHRRIMSDGDSAYEMQTRRPGSAGVSSSTIADNPTSQSQSGMGRSNTTGRRVGEGLKRRFGSLRRSKKNSTEV